ncbi:MAG TPA: LysR family transcriptional regulator [Firmicutes bacterium]|jgi:molybdate transport system regulatory protein|nr:LysR family transcriptional regulator [Bacillota bacterium]
MKIASKLWLERNGEKVFGDGPLDILRRVERLGSLRQAAAEINMSYSQAWDLIRGLEEKLGFALLESQTGGKAGGGSTLTPAARDLVERYTLFRQEASLELERIFSRYFGDFSR